MERLSISDTPQPATSGQNAQAQTPVLQPPPMTAPQLPAQMFTTAAHLLDLTDSESPPADTQRNSEAGGCLA